MSGTCAMTKRDLALLERAFSAEVEGALHGGPHLMQTRSPRAETLVADGFLRKASVTIGAGPLAVHVTGYELTHAGRLAYCLSCSEQGDA